MLCECGRPIGLPAAVVVGTSLQRGGGAGEPHADEGVVVAEGRVGEGGQAVRLLLVGVLPVGLQAGRGRRVRPEQETVQLIDDLLADASLELPGEEGGP